MLARVIHSKNLYWRTGFLLQASSFEKGCSNSSATQNFLIWISPEGSVSLLPFLLTCRPPFPLPPAKGAEVKEYIAVCWLWLFWQDDTMSQANWSGVPLPCCENTSFWQRCRWLYGFSASASSSTDAGVCSHLSLGGVGGAAQHCLTANAGVWKNAHWVVACS